MSGRRLLRQILLAVVLRFLCFFLLPFLFIGFFAAILSPEVNEQSYK